MNPAGLPCGSFGFSLPRGSFAIETRSEKPNDPQVEPAGFGVAAYGFWWCSPRSVLISSVTNGLPFRAFLHAPGFTRFMPEI